MRITVETILAVARRDAAVAALRALVTAAGGYVSEGTIEGSDESGLASYTVKVPATAVTDFRRKVAGLGEVKSDSEKAEDVTEARADCGRASTTRERRSSGCSICWPTAPGASATWWRSRRRWGRSARRSSASRPRSGR